MNHQPFRDWLVADETLSTEQSRSLQAHLAECESCSQLESAWKNVELALDTTPEAGPKPGFTLRWQARLAETERLQLKRQGWISITITAIVAAALVVILAFQVWPLLQDPGPFISVWLGQMVSLVSDYFILRTFFTTNTWIQPFNILVGSFLLVGMISFMSVLWITAYKKIILARRVE